MDLKLWENKGDQETVRKVVWLISSVSLRNFREQEGDFNLSVIQQTHGHNSILCSDVSRTHRLAQNLRPFPSLPPLGWVSLKLLQTNESVLKRLSINNLIAQCLGSLILNSHIYQLQSFFFFYKDLGFQAHPVPYSMTIELLFWPVWPKCKQALLNSSWERYMSASGSIL